MVDEQPHQLLGLRDGGRVIQRPAIEVDERQAAQFYRIGGDLPFRGGDRAALDDVEVVAFGDDRGVRARLPRKLDGVTELLQQLQLEASQRLLHFFLAFAAARYSPQG